MIKIQKVPQSCKCDCCKNNKDYFPRFKYKYSITSDNDATIILCVDCILKIGKIFNGIDYHFVKNFSIGVSDD